jgi:hypothetical protein
MDKNRISFSATTSLEAQSLFFGMMLLHHHEHLNRKIRASGMKSCFHKLTFISIRIVCVC